MKRESAPMVLRALGPTAICITLGYALLRQSLGEALNMTVLGAILAAAILATVAAWWPRPK